MKEIYDRGGDASIERKDGSFGAPSQSSLVRKAGQLGLGRSADADYVSQLAEVIRREIRQVTDAEVDGLMYEISRLRLCTTAVDQRKQELVQWESESERNRGNAALARAEEALKPDFGYADHFHTDVKAMETIMEDVWNNVPSGPSPMKAAWETEDQPPNDQDDDKYAVTRQGSATKTGAVEDDSLPPCNDDVFDYNLLSDTQFAALEQVMEYTKCSLARARGLLYCADWNVRVRSGVKGLGSKLALPSR